MCAQIPSGCVKFARVQKYSRVFPRRHFACSSAPYNPPLFPLPGLRVAVSARLPRGPQGTHHPSQVHYSARFSRRWISNPSEKCSYERPTRGTVCGTVRSMCGADAGCLGTNYHSLDPVSSMAIPLQSELSKFTFQGTSPFLKWGKWFTLGGWWEPSQLFVKFPCTSMPLPSQEGTTEGGLRICT